jgi:hypothetical protein
MRSLRFCAVASIVVLAVGGASLVAASAGEMRVATFVCDITPPLGQPLFACDVLRTVERPLLAKGIVLEAGGQRYVLCALDWCELCNEGHEGMRRKIAAAAGADVAHVAVQTVHQHSAPLVDCDAQKLLAEAGATRLMLDPKALDAIEQRLAAAVKDSLSRLEPFNRIGAGQAKVDRVAANRRVRDASGKIRTRWSGCADPAIRALPEGKIDPYLKTITLARDGKPLVRLHYYATHPQSRYRDGRASSDFVGSAREAMEAKEHVFQIYFTGCAGDITVGKYNDGSEQCRAELAERLLAAMEASVAATQWVPAEALRWRTHALRLPPRTDPGFTVADCLARMKNPKVHGAERVYMGAVWVAFHRRSQRPIELSSLEIGRVHILNLPGEPVVDFQLFAQGPKPADFVAVAGYGDCAPGYICAEKIFAEGGYEPGASNVKPESEALLKKAIAELLGIDGSSPRAISQ